MWIFQLVVLYQHHRCYKHSPALIHIISSFVNTAAFTIWKLNPREISRSNWTHNILLITIAFQIFTPHSFLFNFLSMMNLFWPQVFIYIVKCLTRLFEKTTTYCYTAYRLYLFPTISINICIKFFNIRMNVSIHERSRIKTPWLLSTII